jgi:TRAP-type C4-dicarboxylate transport system substrate-binding protein
VVWDVYQSTPALKKVLEDRYKQVFIANGIVGNYGLVTNFKWDKVPELKGRKLAAIGPNIPWLQGTGAVGVQSTLNEAYTSMQTGVYEGWVMLADPILAFKLNEVSKQYVDMDFGCQATPLLTMNRDTLRSMPADLQKIFLDAGKDYNEAMGQVTWEKQVAAVKRMKELGLETRQADEETKRAWAKQLPNIPKQRFEEINKAKLPGEVVYAYIKALKAAGHKFPRDWEAER